MSHMTPVYYYSVEYQPIEPEVFENISFQHHNPKDIIENFNVEFCVRFRFCHRSGQIYALDIPSAPISSHYISCEQFFQQGSSFLRSKLYHPLLPYEVLDGLIPKLMFEAQELFNKQPRCRSCVGDCSVVVYPLAVDVAVYLPDTEEVVSEIGRLLWESEQQVRMLPASEEAIQSLNVQEIVISQDQCCSICLEDLCDGELVSTMPCDHIFHNHCIVQWLKNSHMCPLCRYSMPNES